MVAWLPAYDLLGERGRLVIRSIADSFAAQGIEKGVAEGELRVLRRLLIKDESDRAACRLPPEMSLRSYCRAQQLTSSRRLPRISLVSTNLLPCAQSFCSTSMTRYWRRSGHHVPEPDPKNQHAHDLQGSDDRDNCSQCCKIRESHLSYCCGVL
jgi:hypothetical protein